ncbi:MAG: hypothetical protein WCO56_16330 [Verrucomicrobiota bacterium]
MADHLTSPEQVHGGSNAEVNFSERKLEIKLSHPDLGRELSDSQGKVKFFGYSVHRLQSSSILELTFVHAFRWPVGFHGTDHPPKRRSGQCETAKPWSSEQAGGLVGGAGNWLWAEHGHVIGESLLIIGDKWSFFPFFQPQLRPDDIPIEIVDWRKKCHEEV